MQPQKPQLFYAPHSSYSQRVLVALELKEILYEPNEVDLFDADQRAAYLRVNPFGKIPTLQTSDNHFLHESIIILEYLDQHYPTRPRLFPQEPRLQLQVRFYERLIDTYINAPRNRLFSELIQDGEALSAKEKARQTDLLDTACKQLNDQLTRQEQMVEEEKSRESGMLWLVGTDCSAADCAALPVFNMLQLFYDLTSYPALYRYVQKINEEPAFRKVWQMGLLKLEALLVQVGFSAE